MIIVLLENNRKHFDVLESLEAIEEFIRRSIGQFHLLQIDNELSQFRHFGETIGDHVKACCGEKLVVSAEEPYGKSQTHSFNIQKGTSFISWDT